MERFTIASRPELFQHAYALELLRDHLRPGMRALDVGSGSGYLTACMALMVGEAGRAVGIDHVDELVSWSRQNLARGHQGLLDSGRVKFVGETLGRACLVF